MHGVEAAENAQAVTGLLTGIVPLAEADEASLAIFRQEQPSLQVAADGSVVETLVRTGLASSNTTARQLLKDNAVSLNGQKVQRETFEAGDFVDGRLLLRKGKKFKDTALVELAG